MTATGTLTDIEDALVYLFRGKRMASAYTLLNRKAGVSLDRSSYLALAALEEHESMRLSDLSEACGLDVSTMSRQVNRLLCDGLLESNVSTSDRRALLLRPSERGHELLQRLKQARREALSELLADWSDDDKSNFAKLLRRFTRSMQKLTLEESNQ